MSHETDDGHDCFRNADWNPDDATPPNPVMGTCRICGTVLEHYCDDYVPMSDPLTLVSHERHTDIPIYAIRYDCDACGRELETRFKKQGTFDRNSGQEVYGP